MSRPTRPLAILAALPLAALPVLAILAGCIGVSQSRRASLPSGGGGATRCPHGVRPAAGGAIDDFEDGDLQLAKVGGRDGYWWTKQDTFGAKVTTAVEEGGAGGSDLALHATGATTSGGGDDNWGAGFGVNFLAQGLLYDASKYAGIAFSAKAGPSSARQVRFKIGDVNTHKDAGVCTTCWNHFGADLTLTGEWRTYQIRFAEVEQELGWGAPRPDGVTASRLVSLDFTIGPGRAFDLWLDDVVFLECKP